VQTLAMSRRRGGRTELHATCVAHRVAGTAISIAPQRVTDCRR